ncbi:MAG: tetratricopeptide repeat protein [Acidobacteriota bacterium]
MRGDLEAIVRKAIHRDRERRYQSAIELAEDIERFLAHRPVRARPATPLYRARRWLRRNRVSAVAAGLAFAGLVGGFVTRSLEADRARRAADRAEAALAEAEDLSQFVLQLFHTANPEDDHGQATVRQLLDRGRTQLETELADRPLARARFATTLGHIYARLAEYEVAEQLVRQSLELFEASPDASAAQRLGARTELATILRRRGRVDEARGVIEPLIAELESQRPTTVDAERTRLLALAGALNDYGNILWQQALFEAGERAYRRALELKSNLLGDRHSDVAITQSNLGVLLREQGRRDEARVLLKRATMTLADTVGPDHPWLAAPLAELGSLQMRDGHWRRAESSFHRVREIYRAAYGDEHPHTVRAMAKTAQLLSLRGRVEEELALRDRIIETRIALGDAERRFIPTSYSARARAHLRLGATDAAARDFYRAFALRVAAAQDADWAETVSEVEITLAGDGGRFATLEGRFLRRLASTAEQLGDDHAAVLQGRAALGWLLESDGRSTDAEPHFTTLLETRRRVSGERHVGTAWAAARLAAVRLDRGDTREVAPLLAQAEEGLIQRYGQRWPHLGYLYADRARLAQRRGLPSEARRHLSAAVDQLAPAYSADHREVERLRRLLHDVDAI